MSRDVPRDGRGRRRKYVGVTEEAHALDVRQLRRNGLLLPGCTFGVAWPGRRTRYFRVANSLDALSVIDGLSTLIPLFWTACTFGGRRPWFYVPV